MRAAAVATLALLALLVFGLALRGTAAAPLAQETPTATVASVNLPLVAGIPPTPTATFAPSATAGPAPTATPAPLPSWRRPGTQYFRLTVADVQGAPNTITVTVRNDSDRVTSGVVVARTFYTEDGTYTGEQFQLYPSTRIVPGEVRRLTYLTGGSVNGRTTRMEAFGFPAQ